MPHKKFSLEIESDPNNLLTVEEFVNYFAREIGIKEEKISGLILSVTEATTNAIIHGNKKNTDKKVKIDVSAEGHILKITVKDEGIGFDPSLIPDPTKPENLLKDSGRGLYLMKVYMDDIKFKITPDGTETILVLNF
ncbi:MAG TPA: ATP-binding protein [Ignavibacteriaceae bacterium]|nr:ATP-binding protein [Ignavibacteriaceae bacterium]